MHNLIPVEFCHFRRKFLAEEIIKHRQTVKQASVNYGLNESVIKAIVKMYLKRK